MQDVFTLSHQCAAKHTFTFYWKYNFDIENEAQNVGQDQRLMVRVVEYVINNYDARFLSHAYHRYRGQYSKNLLDVKF